MKKIITKALCLLLCTVFCALGVMQIGVNLGVGVASAGISTELWMLEDIKYMTKNGSRSVINAATGAAPYFSTSDGKSVAFVPMSAIKAYAGGTVAVEGTAASVTPSGATAYSVTNGATAYKQGNKDGALLYPAAIKDGELYLSTGDILKLYTNLKCFVNHDTGLIIFSTGTLAYDTTYSSLSEQIKSLDALLFTPPSESAVIADMTAKMGALDAHPKLLVNQDRFDTLAAIYAKTEGLTEDEALFKSYIKRVISTANSYFAKSFVTDENNATATWNTENGALTYRQPYYLYDDNGKRLYGKTTYTNGAGEEIKLSDVWQEYKDWNQSSPYADGYDIGGRSNLDVVSRHLKFFGFAWQITGEGKWADAFYLAAMEISKWEHWGEGHFLDCADGAFEYALGFDWIYNAFKDTEAGRAKLRKMAETLYVLGVEVGYNGMMNRTTYTSTITNANLTNEHLKARNQKATLHKSIGMGENWRFHWSNNWQLVCMSGMIVSALAVMEYSDMKSVSSKVVSQMTDTLNDWKCLLYYAPDGSYLESAGYWAYSTKSYTFLITALDSALGKTYGFLDTVGLQDSYYFATYIADSDFFSWNYHDGSRARTDAVTYYMASRLFDDPNIALARDIMLGSGKLGADIYDVLFYDPALSEGGERDKLDYHGKGIDTVTVRDSWDSDAIFAGLHAGANSVTHGDIDSGNFILSAGGVVWFGDRGGENYNIANFKTNDYFSNTYRYLYYKKSIVAHNSVFLISNTLDRGQAFNTMNQKYARITNFSTDQFGTVAIADMTPQFNPASASVNTSITTSAKRGLLFTNSRSSVIIQDEMKFKTPQTLVWSAETDKIASMSEDGRTAYLRSYGKDGLLTMRVSIVSEDENLKFTVLDDPKQTFLTYNTDVNGGKLVTKTGSGNERASDPGVRLIVKADKVSEFNFAICCELIEDNREVVGYEWCPMDEWETASDLWVREANQWLEDEKKPVYKYKKSDLVSAMREYDEATTDAERFAIVKRINAIILSIDTSVVGIPELITTCRSYISKYKIMRGSANSAFEESFFSIMKALCGFN
ncbi:MAG: hypothetical protein IJY01_07400 [Clostridia bacterium]|nr:hypothetical protein [Clostridia bacterium]